MLVQLAAESVETKDQAHIQQGKEGEFEAVLTKYLGQAKNTPEPKGEEEPEAVPQENKGKKETPYGVSLASVFVPLNEQHVKPDKLEAGTPAQRTSEVPIVSDQRKIQLMPRQPQRSLQLDLQPRTDGMLLQQTATTEEKGPVAAELALEWAAEKESMPAKPERRVQASEEAKFVAEQPDQNTTNVSDEAAEAELKLPKATLGEPSVIGIARALSTNGEASGIAAPTVSEYESTAPVGTGAVIPELEQARYAQRVGQAARTRKQLITVQQSVEYGLAAETVYEKMIPSLGDSLSVQEFQLSRTQQGENPQPIAPELENFTSEFPEEVPEKTSPAVQVERKETSEIAKEEVSVPDTEDALEVPVQVRASRDQRMDVQGEKLSGKPQLDVRDTKGRSAQGQVEAIPSADVRSFEPAVEFAETESPVRKILDFADRENLFPKLVQTMETIVQEERTEVRIQLKPDHLGELKIKLSMERGIMMAEFVVENQAVREVIASQLPQLQTALQNHGTQVADLSVSIGFGEARPDEQGQPNQRQSGRQTQRRLDRMTAANSEKAYSGRSIWNQVDVRA